VALSVNTDSKQGAMIATGKAGSSIKKGSGGIKDMVVDSKVTLTAGEEERELDSVGVRHYYVKKIDELQSTVATKTQNLRRLEAQRNELNATVRDLKDELMKLQEPGSYVGEVVKVMGKKKSPCQGASRG